MQSQNSYTVNGFPSQKKTRTQKTKKWAQMCVDAADTTLESRHDGVREHRRKKFINYQLYNGKMDRRDMELTLNPHGLIGQFIPEEIPHYPIAAPKIDLLVGEELGRRFDYKVVTINQDAINAKKEEKAALWREQLIDIVTQGLDEEEAKEKLEKFADYLKYEWQDIRELTAVNILKYYYEQQNMKYIFNQCFKDYHIAGEEIIQCDLIQNEPIMHKLNPLNVHTLRSGNSPWLQDSDLIIIDEYWNPGRVIDTFHDVLTDKQILQIEEGFAYDSTDDKVGAIHDEPDLFVPNDEVEFFLGMSPTLSGYGGRFVDQNGNIRVLRVYWRSLRKVKKVTYFDEDGDEQVDWFPEDYTPDEAKGEMATTLWINEWWEGTKIGENIYLKLRPKPIQYNSLENPSRCHPGIIGLIASTNEQKAVSTMDRMKQYQYLFDAMKDRLNKALAKYMGPLLELDLAKIPENWDIDKWLTFAYANGIATVDSFKEGNKGAATGKLAGGMNTTGRVLDMQMGNYIQHHINMLEYIKAEMGEIVGITKQREGQISNRETVGGVERSVNQSSHITEESFYKHELFKAKALECFLETAKIAFKNGNKTLQYVLGDESIQMFNVDGDLIQEVDYGILVSFNNKYQELDQVMKELAHAGIQNDKMDFSTLMSIYMSDSLSAIRRMIEGKEKDKIDRDSQAAQQQQEVQQQQIETMASIEEAKIAQDETKNIRDNMTRIEVAMINAQKAVDNGDVDSDGLRDDVELIKHKGELEFKLKELKQDLEKHKDLMKIKEKEVQVKKKAANKKT
jgi:hypothetical protein